MSDSKRVCALRQRRRLRVRARLRRESGGIARLSVFRSQRHVYSQIIDDQRGCTVVAASSLERELREAGGTDLAAARRVGALIAQRALAKGVTRVAFDRGSYLYHGRVKSLAEAAREGGLSF